MGIDASLPRIERFLCIESKWLTFFGLHFVLDSFSFRYGSIIGRDLPNKGSSEVLPRLHRRWHLRLIDGNLNLQPEEPEAPLLDAVSQFRRLGI